jgi:methionyl-tRNA formyltransferase
MRVGLLSTIDAPLLGYIVPQIYRERVPNDAIIHDPKPQSRKDRRVHQERTADRLPPIPLEEFEAQHIPFFVADHSSKATAGLVRALSLDLLVNAGTPRILGPEMLDAPSVGVVNCHPGLLPRFRGCTCVEWAIYLDEQVGNTVHFMNERIDEGPIVLQEDLVFTPRDTYVDVRVKAYEHGHRLLARGVTKIIAEGLRPEKLEPQPVGRYWGVIEPDKMDEVMGKLARGGYAFQR